MISFIDQLSAQALAKALIYTLWAGAVCAAILLLFLKSLPARRVQLRYAVALLAFSGICMSLPVALSIIVVAEENAIATTREVSLADQVIDEAGSVTNGQQGQWVADGATDWETREAGHVDAMSEPSWYIYVLGLWVLGSCFGIVRIFWSLKGAQRLRQSGEKVEGLELEKLCERMGLARSVSIFTTTLSQVPAVCGFFKPVVLLPLSQLTALTPTQIEAIIAHELAHIKRYDYLVNFIQLVAEALLFFNPFLWWVSGQVRVEREACCDALAVEATGETMTYVRTLADVAEGKVAPVANVALAFSGHSGGGSLLDRAKRLLRPTRSPELRLRLPVVVLLVMASLLVGLLMQWTAHAAVSALTPEERIEQVEIVHELYPQYALIEQSDIERKFVTISGKISAPNQAELKGPLRIYSYSINGNSSRNSSHRGRDDGTFSVKDLSGNVKLLFTTEGMAPCHVDLGLLSEGRDELLYEFSEGFNAQIKFVNVAGEPLAGVKLTYYYDLSPGGGHHYAESDNAGIVTFSNMPDYPLVLCSSIHGFQEGRWDGYDLEPNNVQELILEPSQPLEISVRDADTGLPIEGAELRMAARDTAETLHSLGLTREVVGLADAKGLVVANELMDGARYIFFLSAPGYIGQLTEFLVAGSEVSVDLEPERTLKVKIGRVSDSMLNEDGKLKVVESYSVEYGESHTSSGLLRSTHYCDVVDGMAELSLVPKVESEIRLDVGDLSFSDSWKKLSERGEWYVEITTPGEVIKKGERVNRPVELRLVTPKGEPLASGRIRVSYIRGGLGEGRTRYSEKQIVDVIDGIARLEVPTPNQLSVGPEGLKGYWFKSISNVDIPASEQVGPEVVEIETERAGAIAGSVFDANGEPSAGVLISVFEVKSDPSKNQRSLDVSVKNSSRDHDVQNDFLASPLPLGGRFVICAHRDYSYVLSSPIELSEKNPVRRAELHFQEGRVFNGRIVDENDKPIAFAKTGFSFEPKLGHGFSRTGPRSGVNGRFQIKGMDPDIDGQYFLEIDEVPGYHPIRCRIDFSKKEQVIRLVPGQKIRGVVKEAKTGKVIPGAEVYAMRAQYKPDAYPTWFDTSLTDERGRFEFTNLPEGEFKISSRSGKMASGEKAKGRAGQSELVEVEIELYEWEELTPVEP